MLSDSFSFLLFLNELIKARRLGELFISSVKLRSQNEIVGDEVNETEFNYSNCFPGCQHFEGLIEISHAFDSSSVKRF